MTVGIAAICESDSGNPYVILAADRLVTTKQQSAIEHEHPEAKIEFLARDADTVEALGVVAGAISLGEELTENINATVSQYVHGEEDATITTYALTQLAAQEYRHLLQQKVENVVLSQYGFELADLKKQHQFKDDFFQSLMAEVKNIHETINRNLTLLIGGVDANAGGSVYEVSGGDIVGHNKMGYGAVGSGKQPAESEFIQSQYSPNTSFEDGIATTIAAVWSSRQASGVGERMDMGIVGSGVPTMIDDDTIGDLVQRQKKINKKQEEEKREVLSDTDIQLDLGQ